ncbi:MAG: type II toxin-antitoxin system RelB/DinJ family antitoxin [Sulfuricellaceae bacterium]
MQTAAVHVRVDPVTKAQVEAVLSDLGMTPTTAINLFYRQIATTHSLPFETTAAKSGDASTLVARLRAFTDGQAMQDESVDTIRAIRDAARY